MALNVESGVITAPASDGGTTAISLPAGTDPKLLVLITGQLSAGAQSNHARQCVGFVTKDGGSIQQVCHATYSQDAAGAAATGETISTTRCAIVHATDATTTLEAHVAAAGDWTDTGITLTFPSTSSGWRLHYVVLGGSDIEAYAHQFLSGNAVATTDVAAPSGWGRPTAVIFSQAHIASVATTAGTYQQHFGVAKQGATGAGAAATELDGANSCNAQATNRSGAPLILHAGVNLDALGDLDGTVANWPTDGYRIAWSDQSSGSRECIAVAIKGSVQVQVGMNTIPTTQTTDTWTTGFSSPPKAMLLGSAMTASSGSQDTTGTLVTGLLLGWRNFEDDESGWSAAGTDDGQGTMFCWVGEEGPTAGTDIAGYLQPTTATDAPVKDWEGDLNANGNDIDIVMSANVGAAWRLSWIAFAAGAAAAPGPTLPRRPNAGTLNLMRR